MAVAATKGIKTLKFNLSSTRTQLICRIINFRNLKKHLQVSQACLAHSRGNGLDGSQHGVNELG